MGDAMSNIRFSWLRPSGWTRLGVAGGVAIVFATPMLWALGVFGADDEAIRRAMVFLFAGLWFFVAVGFTIGWSIRGFIVRVKEAEDDDEGAHRPAGGAHPPPHPPAARPPAR